MRRAFSPRAALLQIRGFAARRTGLDCWQGKPPPHKIISDTEKTPSIHHQFGRQRNSSSVKITISNAEKTAVHQNPFRRQGNSRRQSFRGNCPAPQVRPAPDGTLPTPDRFHPAKPFHDNGAALPIRKAAPFTVGGGQPACTGRRNKIPHGLRRCGILHRWAHFFARYLRISMAHATRMTRPLMM